MNTLKELQTPSEVKSLEEAEMQWLNDTKLKQQPFESNFESLRNFECPEWFKNAKFGIWSHWGAQSVAEYGDWYARGMYVEGHDYYRYHLRKYGHPSKFGYKDLVQLWQAEKFDPDALMALYVDAGAQYFVAQAMHHDNFFNYPSKLHKWNAMEVGPKKDIVGLWKKAAGKRGLPFGISEHLGYTHSFFNVTKGSDKEGPYAGVPYDGADPNFKDFYIDNNIDYLSPINMIEDDIGDKWYKCSREWQDHWYEVIKEVIDLYQPDLLYSDGTLPFGDNQYEAGLKIVSHLYNTSALQHGGKNQAVYTLKDQRQEIYSVGINDVERTQLPNIMPQPWQTCTCLGGWFYDVRAEYKKPGHVIEILVDIISKNGNLLLNIPQRPDGTINDECTYILKELAKWNKICGEGVYGTEPYHIFGEGNSKVIIDGWKEEAVNWDSSDYRFTKKANTLYAFQMKWPENNIAIVKSIRPYENIRSVRLLGYGEIPFEQNFGILIARLPDKKPTSYTNCLAIDFC